jgi:Lipocalin-like domain
MPRLLLCSVAVCCLATFPAHPQPDDPAKRFPGAWRIVSVTGQPPGIPGFYDHPSGLLIYDSSGWMSVQIANHGNRKPWPPNGNGATAMRRGRTMEEKAAAFDDYFTYYGTYTIDPVARTVTHHLEDATAPGSRGIANLRYFEFQGPDRVLLSVAEDGKGGLIPREATTLKLLWERIH